MHKNHSSRSRLEEKWKQVCSQACEANSPQSFLSTRHHLRAAETGGGGHFSAEQMKFLMQKWKEMWYIIV